MSADLAEKRLLSYRIFDELLATKVMEWERMGNDWYTKDKQNFRYDYAAWSPTQNAECNQLIWIKCLARAADLGYELSQNIKDSKYHLRGSYPGVSILVVDLNLNMAVCRFAAKLFNFEVPYPYGHDPLGPDPFPGTLPANVEAS